MVDIKFWFRSSRAQAYLVWLLLLPIGFTATHFYQRLEINYLWIAISIIGFFVMYKVMPLAVSQMKLVYAAWLIPIAIGMIISVAPFFGYFTSLLAYLGVVWLLVMAVGYFLNGLFDLPMNWYIAAVIINVSLAMLIILVPNLLAYQYLLAAIASAWSMGNLWLFRPA